LKFIKKIEFPRRFFVTGTDTDVGKSVISAILMVGLKAGYWKPIQSGFLEITDTDWIRKVSGLPDEQFFPETYKLSQPLSPHASAECDGIKIELNSFYLPGEDQFSRLIIEGAGGVMVPLNDRYFMIDLMKRLNLPVILVARSTLGTINHTLLSLDQLRRNNLEVLGVVMNGPKNEINKNAIEIYGRTTILAEVEGLVEVNSKTLQKAYDRYFK
jgi:dethiobiotin synthetase